MHGKTLPQVLEDVNEGVRVQTVKHSSKLIVLILCMSAFMRFYRLETAVFGFDQNRDMIAMRKMYVEKKVPLLGPKEDRERAKFFFGPYHYYYFFPSFVIARGDPFGPLAQAALGGVLLTWVLYLVGSRYLNTQSGMLAAFVHAGSFFFSDWERQFTNPYHLPLLTMCILFLLHKSVRENQWWIVPSCVIFGFAIQTHLAAFFFLPVFLFFFRSFAVRPFVFGFAAFLATLVPLIIFDVRHDGLNSKLLLSAVSERTGQGKADYSENFQVVYDYFLIAFARFFTIEPSRTVKALAALVLPLTLGSLLVARKIFKPRLEAWIIGIIPLLYLVGYTLTAGDIRKALTFTEISIHQFYVPAFALLLLGSFIITPLLKTKGSQALLTTILAAFLVSNLSGRLAYDNPVGYRYRRAAVDYIVSHTLGNPFSISVIDKVAYGYLDGFEYLFQYLGKGNVLDFNSPTYTIHIPPLPGAMVRFGDISVTAPQT